MLKYDLIFGKNAKARSILDFYISYVILYRKKCVPIEGQSVYFYVVAFY